MRIRYSTEQSGKAVKKAIVYTQDEHGIRFSAVDPKAVYIVECLQSSGYETYIVGGAVRDLILGKSPKDFDIVSAASPGRIKKLFHQARIIGHRFRLVHVRFGSKVFEVSTFRSLRDGLTSNTFGTIEEDVLRRDFTLNALFYDPLTQLVVDYVGGIPDIRKQQIRPIIPLATIFSDDPVRMIRALKYAAATGFTLPLSLKWKIKRQAPLLAGISPSRLTEELSKIIHSSSAVQIVEKLLNFGVYEFLQPHASHLMKEQPAFRSRYLDSLKRISYEGFKGAPGEALAALIGDYLEEITQWDGAIPDQYKNTFMAARRFIMPINPSRAELDQAVRRIFKAHGIIIKKSHFSEWGRRPFPGALNPGDSQLPSGDPPPQRPLIHARKRESPAE
ncbi:MAG: polynucleotide adenylyltransferase PcnB [Treponema sp.]|nr:polynucleotide adenylyltransferase PcnB [Treponema sp.]